MNCDSNSIKQKIIDYSRSIGIDAIGFIKAEIMSGLKDILLEHKQKGYNSGWEEADLDKRTNPKLLLADAKTIIVIAISYQQHEKNRYKYKENYKSYINPSGNINTNYYRGRLAKVSWGQDYHKLVHAKLKLLQEYIEDNIDKNSKNIAFVDTGPLVDREIAVKAGIGFYGYNCNIINHELGSFIYIGSLLTSVDVKDKKGQDITDKFVGEKNGIGSNDTDRNNKSKSNIGIKGRMECLKCNKCIDACPTRALIAPYVLNSKKCLAYLTLTKGEEGNDYIKYMTDQIYGCDICQLVCPHNIQASNHRHSELNEIDDVKYPDLIELLTISNKQFQAKFGHTSGVWRGKKPWQRNALFLIEKRKIVEAIPTLRKMIAEDPRADMRELAERILKQLEEK